VWQAIAKQAQEQKQLDAQRARSVSVAPKKAKPFKPKIVSPQASKTKKTSAQEIQHQKVQAKTVRSKPQTTSEPSSSLNNLARKNQSAPLSINRTEKMIDSLSTNPTVKKVSIS
jgi:hypothetical protein